jgi:hypothetical protein
MEQPRELPLEVLAELRTTATRLDTTVTRLETTVTRLASDIADMRHEFRTDIRRLDERVFQLILAQFATLAAALGALVTALVS